MAGTDVPGTLVTLHIRRDGQPLQPVTLRRASTADLADRKRMFGLFTKAKDFLLLNHLGAWSDERSAPPSLPPPSAPPSVPPSRAGLGRERC